MRIHRRARLGSISSSIVNPVSFVTTVLVLSLATTAMAEEASEAIPGNVQEARERIQRGEALFEQGNFDAALVEFQQAYDVIGDHPNRYLVLYNIGQCHERSFRYDQALRFYRQYLDEGGDDAEGRERVMEEIENLRGLLATLRISIDIDTAEVWIDDRRVGTAPGTVRIPGGVHTVEIRAPGHLTATEEIELPAGGERELTFALEPLPERFEGLHQAYFWTAGGLTIATAVTAAIIGVLAFQRHNDADRRLSNDRERWNVSQDEIDEIGNLALTADILFGVTALFAIGTIVFGLLTNWDGDDPEEEARASRSPSISFSAGPNGLSLSGSF